MRVVAVTCIKNEGPFLLEWVAYNRLIGVTDFLVYSNDCTDGSTALLDALAERIALVHVPNPASGRHYQMEALKHAATHPSLRAADWVWITDVDEFLNIHTGAHRIDDLVRACGTPDAISINFQFFANGGVTRFVDAPVIGQFTRTHNPDLFGAEAAIEVKTLTRTGFPLRYFGAHRPFLRRSLAARALPRWTDASGRPVSERFLHAATKRRIRAFRARGARQFATLNHYALRALDSYLVKSDRGDVNRAGRRFDTAYWQLRNDASWEDPSIQRHLPALRDAIAALKADPAISACHAACVAAHRARCAELLAQPAYRALYDTLRTLPTVPETERALAQRLGVEA
ncbi:glycosyltransferase family 2 protein [Cognatishimia sp. F0-27]|uniref:glycosyltransferase family 2 protein n=1 Tax=Cognatishimia sp. F0-27 TaxID=2816855 RepID=UPI001D0C7A27|nr:glycosyltransferase family 2 protein [Cognatishimia sp. F0-27]MCC1493446.1 glycosyltransferase family 2 protein [Cognatishimia sp. F0-27]